MGLRGSVPAAVAIALAGTALFPLAAVELDTEAGQPCPQVISHRAGNAVAPENTVVGIEAVAARGVEWVEMDVRWSLGNGTTSYPGWPILMHDATTTRTTGASHTVASTGLTTLLKLSAAQYAPWKTDSRFNGYRSDGSGKVAPPYAHDFLSAVSRTGIMALLDVKVLPNKVQADNFMSIVDRFPGLRSKIVYMSSASGVSTMRGWYPNLNYWIIEYPPTGTMRPGSYLSSASSYVVQSQWGDLTAPAVTYWHSFGYQVATWTSDSASYDTEANWRRLADMGVDYLITNRAAEAETYFSALCPSSA